MSVVTHTFARQIDGNVALEKDSDKNVLERCGSLDFVSLEAGGPAPPPERGG